MSLNKTQLRRLRLTIPHGNRLAQAIALAEVTQLDVELVTGLKQSYISDVARNRYQTITVENARKLADYFGCAIEDLFPARQAVAS